MTWPRVKETVPVPLSTLLPLGQTGGVVVTVSKGQAWDHFLEGAFHADAVVLVLDRRERPLYAFRRAAPAADSIRRVRNYDAN